MIWKEMTTSIPKIYALPSKIHMQAIRGNGGNSRNTLQLKKSALLFGKHGTLFLFAFISVQKQTLCHIW